MFISNLALFECTNLLFGSAQQRAGFRTAVVETQGHAIGAAARHDERQEINLAHPVAALCQSRQPQPYATALRTRAREDAVTAKTVVDLCVLALPRSVAGGSKRYCPLTGGA